MQDGEWIHLDKKDTLLRVIQWENSYQPKTTKIIIWKWTGYQRVPMVLCILNKAIHNDSIISVEDSFISVEELHARRSREVDWLRQERSSLKCYTMRKQLPTKTTKVIIWKWPGHGRVPMVCILHKAICNDSITSVMKSCMHDGGKWIHLDNKATLTLMDKWVNRQTLENP